MVTQVLLFQYNNAWTRQLPKEKSVILSFSTHKKSQPLSKGGFRTLIFKPKFLFAQPNLQLQKSCVSFSLHSDNLQFYNFLLPKDGSPHQKPIEASSFNSKA